MTMHSRSFAPQPTTLDTNARTVEAIVSTGATSSALASSSACRWKMRTSPAWSARRCWTRTTPDRPATSSG